MNCCAAMNTLPNRDLNPVQLFLIGDEASQSFLSILDEEDVKGRLNLRSAIPVVAIKLENGSAPCLQVAS